MAGDALCPFMAVHVDNKEVDGNATSLDNMVLL